MKSLGYNPVPGLDDEPYKSWNYHYCRGYGAVDSFIARYSYLGKVYIDKVDEGGYIQVRGPNGGGPNVPVCMTSMINGNNTDSLIFAGLRGALLQGLVVGGRFGQIHITTTSFFFA